MVIEDSVAAITLAKRNGAGQIVAIGEKADGSDLIRLGAEHYIHDFKNLITHGWKTEIRPVSFHFHS